MRTLVLCIIAFCIANIYLSILLANKIHSERIHRRGHSLEYHNSVKGVLEIDCSREIKEFYFGTKYLSKKRNIWCYKHKFLYTEIIIENLTMMSYGKEVMGLRGYDVYVMRDKNGIFYKVNHGFINDFLLSDFIRKYLRLGKKPNDRNILASVIMDEKSNICIYFKIRYPIKGILKKCTSSTEGQYFYEAEIDKFNDIVTEQGVNEWIQKLNTEN